MRGTSTIATRLSIWPSLLTWSSRAAYAVGVASAGVDCGYKQACAIGAAVAGLAIRFRLHRRKDREAAQRHGALVGAAYLAALARYNALQGGATSEAAGGADAADASLPARIAAQSMAAALVYDVGGVVLLHFGFFTLSIGAPTRLLVLSLLCPLALPAASWRATLPYWLVMQLAVGAIAYGFESSHRQSYLRLKREDPRPSSTPLPPRWRLGGDAPPADPLPLAAPAPAPAPATADGATPPLFRPGGAWRWKAGCICRNMFLSCSSSAGPMRGAGTPERRAVICATCSYALRRRSLRSVRWTSGWSMARGSRTPLA